ncbi:MAG: hypothetical protein DMF88_02840 [Acidobacteria bacterium]|nr:MAG: hypothetical protein DMF88_02840 [Acidobacteriota bacterium]
MTFDMYPSVSVARPGSPTPLAVLATAAAGTALAFGLLQVSYVWTALFLVGLTVIAGSFVAKDAKLYWLLIFLVAIPINITKMFFFTPDDIDRLMRSHRLFVNEIVVPFLHLSDLPLLVLLAFWLGEIVRERKRVHVPRGLLLAVAFVLWCLLTSLTARAPDLALAWLFYEAKYVGLVLWFANAALSRKAVTMVFAALLICLLAQGVLVITSYKFQLGSNFYGDLFGARETRQSKSFARHAGEGYVYETGSELRGSGTIGVGNETAKYLVPLIPLAMAGALLAPGMVYRALGLLAFGAGFAGLYFTFSRGGLLSAMVGLGLVPLLMAARGLISRKALVALVTAGLVMLAASVPVFYYYFTTRPGFYDLRLKHMRYGLQILAKNPIVGVGANNFNVSLSKYDYGGVFAAMPIHNHYLRLAIETGLVGLVLYLSFFAWIAVLAYRSMWSNDALLTAMAIGLCSGIVGSTVHWFDDLFYGPAVSTQWWTLCGLVLVIHQHATRSPASPSEQ